MAESLFVTADILLMFQNGLNALHLAAKMGYMDVINELLQRKIDVNAATKVAMVNCVLNCQIVVSYSCNCYQY